MIVLGIETSCDETALALLECSGTPQNPHFKILSEELFSQIDIHKPFGGVFPMLAKREHGKNLIPLFKNLLEKAGVLTLANPSGSNPKNSADIKEILAREKELSKDFLEFIPTIEKPPFDAIAVTTGPGLEPALWVGINFAKALSSFWNIPLIPTNHMEGHIYSVLLEKEVSRNLQFPLIALLVSGGHTQLILVKDWLQYELLGETRDDAVGEAFDKVARILGLPYPGGPEISRLANEARTRNYPEVMKLPRPMLESKDYDFSFSGLKTAVLYGVKKLETLSDEQRASIAREFEDAAIEVLLEKTKRALQEHGAKALIIGGGVVANRYLREKFTELLNEFSDTKLLLPEQKLSTDNAVMIAMAAYVKILAGEKGILGNDTNSLGAKGRLTLTN